MCLKTKNPKYTPPPQIKKNITKQEEPGLEIWTLQAYFKSTRLEFGLKWDSPYLPHTPPRPVDLSVLSVALSVGLFLLLYQIFSFHPFFPTSEFCSLGHISSPNSTPIPLLKLVSLDLPLCVFACLPAYLSVCRSVFPLRFPPFVSSISPDSSLLVGHSSVHVLLASAPVNSPKGPTPTSVPVPFFFLPP